MQNDVRLNRLAEEFELMKSLLQPHALIEFWCADLSAEEAPQFLRSKFSFDVITEGFPGFLPPQEFEKVSPGLPPEKYMIRFNVRGLWREEDGAIRDAPYHLMEVVFGADYPSKAPTFVWLTPIWHPNLKRPYICLEGRPFAVGWTLDLIVQEVGRLVSYQSYNVNDPLNKAAADWARDNRERFPVDERDLLDSRVIVTRGQNAAQAAPDGGTVIEVSGNDVQMDDPGSLVELVD